MDKRRIITVIVSRISQHNSSLISGIIQKANELNFNVAVYSMFSDDQNATKHQIGEEKIFEQINFNYTDGVIFIDYSFWSQRILTKVAGILKEKCKSPVVCINSGLHDSYGFFNLKISEKRNFGKVVSHLIDNHGFERIYCLTGTKGSFASEERLAGYLDAMHSHGLKVPENYVFYGDFWTESAKKLADRISSGQIPLPQAIACANDIMAITLTNQLKSNGIAVPSVIAVTGFDAISDSFLNTPSITTFAPPEKSYGAACVHSLVNIIEGRHPYSFRNEEGQLICNDSCGCHYRNDLFTMKNKNKIREKEQLTFKIENSNMQEELMMAAGTDDFVNCVDRFTYLINEYKRYFLCLSCNFLDELSGKKNNYDDDQTVILLDKVEFVKVTKNRVYNTDDIFPALSEPHNQPGAFFFTPLHFDEKYYGFSAIEFKDKEKTIDNLYRTWNKYISNALHMLDIRSTALSSQTYYSHKSSSSVLIPPHWMFVLMNQMNKPENFIQGLPQMIKLAHLSQEHLTRAFRKYINVTPTQYINNLRLTYAAGLLVKSSHDITEICFLCGFNNLSHFYHQFKKKFNCSPKQYIQNRNAERQI